MACLAWDVLLRYIVVHRPRQPEEKSGEEKTPTVILRDVWIGKDKKKFGAGFGFVPTSSIVVHGSPRWRAERRTSWRACPWGHQFATKELCFFEFCPSSTLVAFWKRSFVLFRARFLSSFTKNCIVPVIFTYIFSLFLICCHQLKFARSCNSHI